MTAAALVSTGFFAAPVVISHRDRAVPEPSAVTAPLAPADRVQLVTTDVVVAEVSTPVLQAPAARVAPIAAHPTSRPRASARLADRTIGRRVVRLIAGDGRYTVRPFPTVDSTER